MDKELEKMISEASEKFGGIKYYFKVINARVRVLIMWAATLVLVVVAIPGSIAFYYNQRNVKVVEMQLHRIEARDRRSDLKERLLDQRENSVWEREQRANLRDKHQDERDKQQNKRESYLNSKSDSVNAKLFILEQQKKIEIYNH